MPPGITETDICIVGAGPAGSTAALTIATTGQKAMLIDKAVFPRDKICGDAISGKAVEVLNYISPEIVGNLSRQAHQLGSWGVSFFAPNGKKLRLPFLPHSEHKIAPGFIYPRKEFDHFLLQQLKPFSNIQIRQGTCVSKFEKRKNVYRLYLTGGEAIDTKLLLVASGNRSGFGNQPIARKHHCAGLRVYYHNVAGLDHENFIELHFIKSLLPGYFWIFPLPDGRANVGIGMRSDIVSGRKLNLNNILMDIIHHHPIISQRFRDAEAESKPVGCGLPLGSVKRKLSGDRFMLLGDAGGLIDPFTGEGIGNAMMSGWLAGKQAVEAVRQQQFSAGYLKAYDDELYLKIGSELAVSYKLQQLARYSFLFNFVVNKARKKEKLRATISKMFVDVELRKRLKDPIFFAKMFF